MIKLEYKNYNVQYPAFFSNEKKIISAAMATKVKIIHIGSTSIPDLGGKEVIDILLTVDSNYLNEAKNNLLNLDYQHNLNLSFGNREFFSKDKEKNKDNIRIHLHLTYDNSDAHKKAVLFKKYLLNDKKLIIEYQQLKTKAMKKAQGDYKIYRQIKNKYIEKLIK
jgi:GrpB-like predicted nucleotidyltransferase (UPF0157 family)